MTNWQQYHQQFASALKARMRTAAAADWGLTALIDSWPYYGSPDWTSSHRGTLSNLLQLNLPNDKIESRPAESLGLKNFVKNSYVGPFSGYRDAFFHGVTSSRAAELVGSAVERLAGGGDWWGKYAVAVLTDAVRKTISISIDTSRLDADLAAYHKTFLPALTTSCSMVFCSGFMPTATTLENIIGTGRADKAGKLLQTEICAGHFTANINQAIAQGGDGAVAAAWFLFNLWITCALLGISNDWDSVINTAKSAGLTVPNEVGPGNWLHGGYTDWFTPLAGSDVIKAASGTIVAAMPSESELFTSTGIHTRSSETLPNGYAQSLCIWGPLNFYRS